MAASAFFVALLALIAASAEQVYSGVVKPLLTPNGLAPIFWVGALIAALIPVGHLSVYSCLAFIACGRGIWNFISRH